MWLKKMIMLDLVFIKPNGLGKKRSLSMNASI